MKKSKKEKLLKKNQEEKNELDEVLDDILEKEKYLKPRSIEEYEM